MDNEIERHLISTGITTAGSIAGIMVANRTGWNKTITVAAGGLVGLIIGVTIGLIGEKKAANAG
ncbi:MAG: hypothetical protein AAF843_18750 [Bacteroidota bacterium]